MGLMKPDVACPTGGVPSTTKGGGYTTGFSGTSAATPHCGGAACLIVSANPSIEPVKITQALKMNAVDLGSPGLDVLFGSGRIDVYEAVINVLSTLLADNISPPVGTTVNFALEGPANKTYAIVLSLNLGETTFPGVGTFDIAPPYFIMQIGVLNASGQAGMVLNIPNTPGLSGTALHFQSVVDDLSGATGLYLISLHETVTIQ
jgi:subtilisin family serine protease